MSGRPPGDGPAGRRRARKIVAGRSPRPAGSGALFPDLRLDRARLNDLVAGEEPEWLETNGLGGYALLAVNGALTRRYSGLLIAATRPPVGRMLVVAGLDEVVSVDGVDWPLSAHRVAVGAGVGHDTGVLAAPTAAAVVAQDSGAPTGPAGRALLESFERFPVPALCWRLGTALFSRRVIVEHGANTVAVRYRLERDSDRARRPAAGASAAAGARRAQKDRAARLTLRPLLAFRDHHAARRADPEFSVAVRAGRRRPGGAAEFVMAPSDGGPVLRVWARGASFKPGAAWLRGIVHLREVERGLDDRDDYFVPGALELELDDDEADVVLTLELAPPAGAAAIEKAAVRRRRGLLKVAAPEPAWVRLLHLAADQFLVRRGAGSTIVAGYPWFTDWGRDSMISLPGLCFVTGRVEEGGKILSAFAAHARDGLLPNHFPDGGEEPVYNTLDASLWFFQALRQYDDAGGSRRRIRSDLYPAARRIVEAYRAGTRYAIGACPDGLIGWDAPHEALTWMDARVGEWAVTPRRGRPVEIQALWHGALREMARLARRFHDDALALEMDRQADRVRTAFRRSFWNSATGYLFDWIDAAGSDPAIRPNALFAVSLPYDLLPPTRARAVVAVARHLLYTPVGLRSLAASDPDYHPVYEGDRRARDAAYHQGTVWGWLLGPYCEALWRTAADRAAARREVRRILEAAAGQLTGEGMGTFAEIFDGDPPHRRRGCPAQAWSVAELLRVRALVEGR